MDIISIVTIVLSALGVTVALIAVFTQARQNNITLGTTILRDLEKDFHWSEEMRSRRLAAATYLFHQKENDIPPSQVGDILDFFDIVGLYHNKHIIDTEMTWVAFYYWIGYYWQLLKVNADYFENIAGGITYYENFRLLYTKLTKYGRKRKRLPLEEEYFTRDRLYAFLEEEIRQCSPIKGEILSAPTKETINYGDFSPSLSFSFGRKSVWIGITDITLQNKRG